MDRRSVIRTGLAGIAAPLLDRPVFGRSLPGPAGDTLSPADAAGDLAIVKAALALHPGLYRYAAPAAVDARLAAFDADWRRANSRAERYLLLSRFLATIRCGHSYCNFFNQRDAVAAELFDRPTRLPFHFVWVDDLMVVRAGFDTGLTRGTVIRAINGTPVLALRERLRPLVRGDGHNEAKRTSLLEVRGDDRVETFDVFQGLIAPPSNGSHRLLIDDAAGRSRTIDLPAIGLAARRAQMASETAGDDEPRWTWTMRDDGVAVLTMPGWAMWNTKWDWRGWLDDRLDSLGGARGLIVDLRDNEGGEDCGDRILARYLDRPYVAPAVEQRLRFRTTPASLDPHLDTWDNSFRTLGRDARALGNGFYLRPGGTDAMRIDPAPRRLTTPLAVLTSPVNSSATFQFAGTARALGVGRLVGRPTGGNRRGINGGCFFFVRLPASGIEFDLPLVGYFPLAPQPDAGLLPDVPVAATLADIRAGRDPELATAAAILRRA